MQKTLKPLEKRARWWYNKNSLYQLPHGNCAVFIEWRGDPLTQTAAYAAYKHCMFVSPDLDKNVIPDCFMAIALFLLNGGEVCLRRQRHAAYKHCVFVSPDLDKNVIPDCFMAIALFLLNGGGGLLTQTAAYAAYKHCVFVSPDLDKNVIPDCFMAIALFLLNGGEVCSADSGMRRLQTLRVCLS